MKSPCLGITGFVFTYFQRFFKIKIYFYFHFLNMMLHFNSILILFKTDPGPISTCLTIWADIFLLLPPSPWDSTEAKQSSVFPTIILLPSMVHRCLCRSPWICASFFFGHAHGRQKSLGQGSNPHHCNNQSHSSDNSGSLAHWATREFWKCTSF